MVTVHPADSGGFNQQWIEIAYGTRSGAVKLIVQHPENVGQAPQIFESFSVHTCPLSKVVLGEKHLISGEEGVLCSCRTFSLVSHHSPPLPSPPLPLPPPLPSPPLPSSPLPSIPSPPLPSPPSPPLSTVCMENHVRTWNVTRFRGRISTQPGSSSMASYKVLALEGPNSICYPDISIGQ